MTPDKIAPLLGISTQAARRHCRRGTFGAAAQRNVRGQWLLDPGPALAAWRANRDLSTAAAEVIDRAQRVDPELAFACEREVDADLRALLAKCRAAPGITPDDQLTLNDVFALARREWAPTFAGDEE